MRQRLDITIPIIYKDFDLFKSIVNQGIDARLTAFTESRFYQDKEDLSRFVFVFHWSEMEILMRRLSELAEVNELANGWLNDILEIIYGVEVI